MSNVQTTYERIEAAILSGRLKPGQRLVERDLERVLDVSRTPIREALKSLDYAGLVVLTPNRGAVVRDLNVEDVYQLYVVRLPLEKLAVELAQPPTAAQLQDLIRIEERLEEAFDAADFPAMIRRNDELHHGLTCLTGNGWLISTLEYLRRQTYLLVQHGPYVETAGRERAIAEHRQMLAFLKSGDRAKLTNLVLDHVLRTARLYLTRVSALSGRDDWQESLDDLARQLRRLPALAAKPPLDVNRAISAAKSRRSGRTEIARAFGGTVPPIHLMSI